jgi:molybdopterin synthase catalytic subunit
VTLLVSHSIDIPYWIGQCTHPNIGAMSLFIGYTRNAPEDRGIVSLYYEAYEDMVAMVASTLENELKQRYPLMRDLLIIHRTGEVKVSEPSLLVILTGSHRQTLCEATEVCVNLLKQKLPIWKKGKFENGQEEWLTNHP